MGGGSRGIYLSASIFPCRFSFSLLASFSLFPCRGGFPLVGRVRRRKVLIGACFFFPCLLGDLLISGRLLHFDSAAYRSWARQMGAGLVRFRIHSGPVGGPPLPQTLISAHCWLVHVEGSFSVLRVSLTPFTDYLICLSQLFLVIVCFFLFLPFLVRFASDTLFDILFVASLLASTRLAFAFAFLFCS